MNIYKIYDTRNNALLAEGKGELFNARQDLELLHKLANIPYKYLRVLWSKSIN